MMAEFWILRSKITRVPVESPLLLEVDYAIVYSSTMLSPYPNPHLPFLAIIIAYVPSNKRKLGSQAGTHAIIENGGKKKTLLELLK